MRTSTRAFVAAIVFAAPFRLTPAAAAQSFTPVRELKNLSPAAIDKLQALEVLNALPQGEWHYHVGDLPHGEATTLDDTAWSKGEPKPREPLKVAKDAVWFRRTITVPLAYNGYDLTGSRIWFQFEADANGPVPEIIYFNGRRVALGDDLEPIVLFDHAKPGEKVVIAVKLLHTVDDKRWRAVHMRIEPDPATGRPNPDDIRVQAITAANILPSLPQPRKDLLEKVQAAIAQVDLTDLNVANKALLAEHDLPFSQAEKKFGPMLKKTQQKFDASLRAAQETLGQLAPVMATAKIDLAGNAHIDAAWLWPASETIDVVKRTFSTALQLMNEYPDYTFSQSAAQYSEWMADKYPDINKQIAERVKEGRWEIVGGMWVEPDLNLPGGESLVRQLLVGQREFKSLYGVTARIGWNPDSFGYNWQLPQIYKRSGMDYFVTQKMHWNDTNQLPFRLFWWQSPDGSKVLTYFPTDYAWTNVNPTRLSADFAESAARNPGTEEHLDLYGVGDHGGGPTRDMLDQATHWIDLQKTGKVAMPTMRFHTAQQYFDDVQPKLNAASPTWNYDKLAKGWTAPQPEAPGKLGIPTWKDELYFEYHRGIFTSQAKHKENMRRSEDATLDAEKMASFAWLYGQHYPAKEITDSWKKITFNQFHDLAAGSGIAVIYRDAQKDYDEVFHSDALLGAASLQRVASEIDTAEAKGAPVLVTNSLPWSRVVLAQVHVELPAPSDNLEVFSGAAKKPLRVQILKHENGSSKFDVLVGADSAQDLEAPSLGYALLSARGSGKSEEDNKNLVVEEKAGSLQLSNEYLQVVIDKNTGCITSLHGRRGTQASYFTANACGNQLQAFADNPKNYDAWNVDPGTLDKAPTIIDKVDAISVIANGPLRKTVRIERTWQSSHFIQDISLDAGADTVVVDNQIDWHESHVLLKAAFPLAATSGQATFEIPYGSIQRPTTRDNTFSKAQFEVPALRWADLGDDKQGVSILNDSKYAYDALGDTLRLTLLRAPTWPDPDADRGMQHFRYAIYPHTGPWQKAETVHRAYELNQPLIATQTFSHTGTLPPTHSFVSIEGAPSVILTAVKKAEDADALIFRMYESAGEAGTVKLHVPSGGSAAIETNLMEKPEGATLPLASDVVTLQIKPFEIRTVQVSYPHSPAAPATAER